MSEKNERYFVDFSGDIPDAESFGQSSVAGVFEDGNFPAGWGFPGVYAETETGPAPPVRPSHKKAHKAKKKPKARRTLETKPASAAAPSPAEHSGTEGKPRIDKRQMIIYDALLHPKFDE